MQDLFIKELFSYNFNYAKHKDIMDDICVQVK